MKVFGELKRRQGIWASLSNIGWLGGDRVLRMLGAVIVGTAVARYLGPRQFGLFNYAVAIFSLFNIISYLGLDAIVIRDLALDETLEGEILGTSFVLKFIASILTAAAATLVTWMLDRNNETLIYMVALISFAAISQALDVIDYQFQSQTRSRLTAVPRIFMFVVASVARIAAIFLHMGLVAFAWITALELFLTEIGLLISYVLFRKRLPQWNWRLNRAKMMLLESWPLLVSSIMFAINMRTDQVLLGKMSSLEQVGIYSAALRLSEVWYTIPTIVSLSVMPRLLKGRAADPDQYYARVQILYQSMILVSVVLTGCTLLFGPFVIRLLYGPQFSAAARILSIHIWTGIFVAVGCIGGHQYVHERVTISTIQRAGLGAVVNLILNLLWIPRWGATGSAMATLVSTSISSYFGDAFDHRTRAIFRMKTKAYLQFWTLPRLILKRATH